MSTATIAIIVATVLIVLMASAYTVQAMDRARTRKRQLEFALRKRIARLASLLEAFPVGFLTKDLSLLIARGQVDAWEQLCELERGNDTYAKALSEAIKQRDHFRSGGAPQQGTAAPQSAQQFLEIERNLALLQKLITSLSQKGQLTPEEERVLSHHVTVLTARAKLGQHRLNAQEAKQQDKPRLAIHHLQMAVNALKKLNSDHLQADLADLQDQIAQLEEQARQQEEQINALPPENAAVGKEWDSFGQKDETWKKKAVYD